MKTLKALIQDIAVKRVVGDVRTPVTMLCLDSRKMEEGGLFFAQKGTKTDGHQYIPDVIKAGARVVVCEDLPEEPYPGVCFVVVADATEACGMMAAAFWDNPSEDMKVVGITGTNGKTTVATLLFRLFRSLAYSCGLLSTVQNQINDEVIPATHTTPDALHLQALLAQMKAAGCHYVFMEASSHAIVQNRIRGIHFAGAVFTNITHDHLDYHKTFDAYIKAKKKLFDELPASAFALSNMDDRRGEVMLQNTRAARKYYALRKITADFKGRVLANDIDGLQMMIGKHEVHFLLSGLFNAYNLLAVFGVAVSLGLEESEALAHLSALRGAPGRFDTYRSPKDKILGIVDYAHTPDALLNVLTTIRQFNDVREVVTVVGCGGDRDKTKRPEMAEIACKHSQRVILTSDNPRGEDPEAILDDMEQGLDLAEKRKTIRITNRREAIKTACSLAQPGSIILIAGKGHENYQEIKGIKYSFDDKEVLLEMYALLGK
ncbi:MAG TPA: UDP-N-acetylmuramoyl-L-alanyl-D-glutamate--2,6-diaminopimelate ligase [Edaphocola sp.]|nr:UDP-N-acetylmuramoyl-L-alanyl-D-glutamate--2,6-diaminopimelate ligase [Edaphocola sp.]